MSIEPSTFLKFLVFTSKTSIGRWYFSTRSSEV